MYVYKWGIWKKYCLSLVCKHDKFGSHFDVLFVEYEEVKIYLFYLSFPITNLEMWGMKFIQHNTCVACHNNRWLVDSLYPSIKQFWG